MHDVTVVCDRIEWYFKFKKFNGKINLKELLSLSPIFRGLKFK